MIYTIDAGKLGEITVNVKYRYSPCRPATRLDPPEPAELEVISVDLGHFTKDSLEELIVEALMNSDAFHEEVSVIENERDALDADHYYQEMKDRTYEDQTHI